MASSTGRTRHAVECTLANMKKRGMLHAFAVLQSFLVARYAQMQCSDDLCRWLPGLLNPVAIADCASSTLDMHRILRVFPLSSLVCVSKSRLLMIRKADAQPHA